MAVQRRSLATDGHRGSERLAALLQLLRTGTVAPIAEGLTAPALRAVGMQQRAQEVADGAERYGGRVQPVEPGACRVTAQEHVVLAQRRSDEADVAEVRARAAVGAAGHAHGDRRV